MKRGSMNIDDAAVEAEKMGMSYGKYVAYKDGLLKVENISQEKKGRPTSAQKGAKNGK